MQYHNRRVLDAIAKEESDTVRPILLRELELAGVRLLTGHKLSRITSRSVICTVEDGTEKELPCSFVVMAAGASPETFASEQLEASGISVIRVGDCAGGPAVSARPFTAPTTRQASYKGERLSQLDKKTVSPEASTVF